FSKSQLARAHARLRRFGNTHRLAHFFRALLPPVPLLFLPPSPRPPPLPPPLEPTPALDPAAPHPRAHPAHAAPRPHPHDRLLVQLFRLPHPVMPNPHQRLGGGDLPDPAPQVSFPAVLIDAPHHLEKRLLQHILGVLGTPQHA